MNDLALWLYLHILCRHLLALLLWLLLVLWLLLLNMSVLLAGHLLHPLLHLALLA
jgi:hypothetical protein